MTEGEHGGSLYIQNRWSEAVWSDFTGLKHFTRWSVRVLQVLVQNSAATATDEDCWATVVSPSFTNAGLKRRNCPATPSNSFQITVTTSSLVAPAAFQARKSRFKVPPPPQSVSFSNSETQMKFTDVFRDQAGTDIMRQHVRIRNFSI